MTGDAQKTIQAGTRELKSVKGVRVERISHLPAVDHVLVGVVAIARWVVVARTQENVVGGAESRKVFGADAAWSNGGQEEGGVGNTLQTAVIKKLGRGVGASSSLGGGKSID